jgi:hypothetical protein
MTGLFAPLLLALVATTVVAAVGGRLRPRHGAWLTAASIGSVFVTVLVTSWVLTLGFLAHEPVSGDLFAWCREPIGVHHSISRWIGLAALATALWSTIRAWHVIRSWRQQRGCAAAEVHVVELDRPVAYAQTGHGGGVVVSTGMLAALAPDERRALLAHEQAHLRHRHDRFLVVGTLAAGLPPLAPAVKRLRHALERWADEDAAHVVGDRTVVARAVIRAALVSYEEPAQALAILGADVPARVEALIRPPMTDAEARSWAAVAGLVVVTAMASTAVQLHHLASIFAAVCPG